MGILPQTFQQNLSSAISEARVRVPPWGPPLARRWAFAVHSYLTPGFEFRPGVRLLRGAGRSPFTPTVIPDKAGSSALGSASTEALGVRRLTQGPQGHASSSAERGGRGCARGGYGTPSLCRVPSSTRPCQQQRRIWREGGREGVGMAPPRLHIVLPWDASEPKGSTEIPRGSSRESMRKYLGFRRRHGKPATAQSKGLTV